MGYLYYSQESKQLTTTNKMKFKSLSELQNHKNLDGLRDQLLEVENGNKTELCHLEDCRNGLLLVRLNGGSDVLLQHS